MQNNDAGAHAWIGLINETTKSMVRFICHEQRTTGFAYAKSIVHMLPLDAEEKNYGLGDFLLQPDSHVEIGYILNGTTQWESKFPHNRELNEFEVAYRIKPKDFEVTAQELGV